MLTDQRDGDARFLTNLAHRGVVRDLVRLDVAATRQPEAELPMVVEQQLRSPGHEDTHREVARDRRGGGVARAAHDVRSMRFSRRRTRYPIAPSTSLPTCFGVERAIRA